MTLRLTDDEQRDLKARVAADGVSMQEIVIDVGPAERHSRQGRRAGRGMARLTHFPYRYGSAITSPWPR